MDYQVRIVHEPARKLAVKTFHGTPADVGEKIGAAFRDVAEFLVKRGAPPAGPAVAYYEMVEDGFLVAAGFTVPRELPAEDDVVPLKLPDAEVATTTHVGPYEKLPEAYEALKRGAAEQAREVEASGGMWEEYWSGPEVPSDETRTEVFWPLKPR
jgi:effector-binding domain-containing protein